MHLRHKTVPSERGRMTANKHLSEWLLITSAENFLINGTASRAIFNRSYDTGNLACFMNIHIVPRYA